MIVGWGREKLGLPFGTQKFEMSIRHPNGDIKQAVVYISLEFSREVGAENINLRISGIRRRDELSKVVSDDRKDIQGLSPGTFQR